MNWLVPTLIICAWTALTFGLLAVLVRRGPLALVARLDLVDRAIERSERGLREEASAARREGATAGSELRQELRDTLRAQTSTIESVAARIGDLREVNDHQLERVRITVDEELKALRGSTEGSLDGLREDARASARETVDARERLRVEVAEALGEVRDTTVGLLDRVRATLEERLLAIQHCNEDRLDGMREEARTAAREATNAAEQVRLEVVTGVTEVRDTNAQQLEHVRTTLEACLSAMQLANEQRLDAMRVEARTLGRENVQGAERVRDDVVNALKQWNSAEIGRADIFKNTIDERFRSLEETSARKLDEIRQIVDEKLQSTLDKRLGESFRQVSERLEQVHRGLGEVHSLAQGVGDLKKVLANVKTRGSWGEVQLRGLLEQLLSPEQFDCNVEIRSGSRERVEFAIRLPGRDGGRIVWLPLDSKFPLDRYQQLAEAAERGDADAVEAAAMDLERNIKARGREIHDKYLDPPNTTDFAIMFLPTEGLYAEVLRRTGLVEVLQREMRVVVAGPTTLAALLNSLQLGFQTLAIQKRSEEIWSLLRAVSTEFGKFGEVLSKVKKKLAEASTSIDQAEVRTRAIDRKLRNVEQLPSKVDPTVEPNDNASQAGESA